jgi:hypothetical protein
LTRSSTKDVGSGAASGSPACVATCVTCASAAGARAARAWSSAFCPSKIDAADGSKCSAAAISVAVVPRAPAYAIVSATDALSGEVMRLRPEAPARIRE